MRPIAALFAGTVLFGVGVFASAGQNEDFVCDGNTADVTACLLEQNKKIQANLDIAYQQSLKAAADFSADDVARLKDAQRKWSAYRKAACDAELALYHGGTAGGPASLSCIWRVTNERIQALKIAYIER